MLNMGWMGPLTTARVRVLEQNCTQDTLPDATPVKVNGDPVLVGSLVLGASTNSHGSESKRRRIRQYNDHLYRS